MDRTMGKRVISLRERIVAHFDVENWEEVGLLTGLWEMIDDHPRLLRSLSWNDSDYSGHVLPVLRDMARRDPSALDIIEEYLEERFPGEATYVSAKPSERKITFAPSVFQVPDGTIETDLVATMMPFRQEFNAVYETIERACNATDFRCLRADSIWEDSTIIQDIFNLVFRAQVVVVDFTYKNPNVMYETGIAHTLGKQVVPISQSISDVPSDIAHHRVLTYLPNSEGLTALQSGLTARLRRLGGDNAEFPKPTGSSGSNNMRS